MTDNLDYHDSLARAGVSQFEQVGETLRRLSSSLESEIGNDSPWSQDKIGSNFGSQFDPHRATAIDNVKNFAAKVASYGPAITDAADGVVHTDSRD
jgi:hypothetical protein